MFNRPESLQRVATVIGSCHILALDVASLVGIWIEEKERPYIERQSAASPDFGLTSGETQPICMKIKRFPLAREVIAVRYKEFSCWATAE